MFIFLQFSLAFAALVLLIRWLAQAPGPALSMPALVLILSAKVMAGMAYGWVFLNYYGGDDTWMINREGMIEMQKLLDRPGQFFEDLNLPAMVSDYGWVEGLKEFRAKLELALLIKPLALFNIFSSGNYYLNTILFSAFSFWGHYWLYRLFSRIWPGSRSWVMAVVFFYPPGLFWFSGIRSDGLLFSFFGLLLWQLYRWQETKTWGRLVLILVALGGITIIRPATGLLLIPALIAWALVVLRRWKVRTAFPLVYLLAAGIFFASTWLPAPFNLPAAVSAKQSEFLELKGNTRVPLDNLTPDPGSYFKVLPQAISNTTLRPYPWEAKGILQLATVIQNIFLICLFLVMIVRRMPGRSFLSGNAFFALLLFFAITNYLSIGYTIPFPGAMVRYKALPELLLLFIFLYGALGKELSHYDLFNVYKNKGF